MLDERCDLCGRRLPLVIHGKERLNVPCQHSDEANQKVVADTYARLPL